MPGFAPTFSRFKLPLALGICIVSWALAWVSIRAAVAHISPAHVALGRYGVASVVLLPIWLWRRPAIEKRDFLSIFTMGFLGITLYNLCINAGEQTITAGAASLIAATIPIFTIIGATLFLGERVPRGAWAGIWVSLSGVALIALGERGGVGFSSGALLVVLASLCAAAYGLMQKHFVSRYQSIDLTTAAIWGGTLALLPFSGGILTDFRAAPLSATLNVVFLGVFPGAISYILWSQALSKFTVARLVSFLYLISPLSVALGWFFLGELPSWLSLCGGAIALCGVIWTNGKRH